MVGAALILPALLLCPVDDIELSRRIEVAKVSNVASHPYREILIFLRLLHSPPQCITRDDVELDMVYTQFFAGSKERDKIVQITVGCQ